MIEFSNCLWSDSSSLITSDQSFRSHIYRQRVIDHHYFLSIFFFLSISLTNSLADPNSARPLCCVTRFHYHFFYIPLSHFTSALPQRIIISVPARCPKLCGMKAYPGVPCHYVRCSASLPWQVVTGSRPSHGSYVLATLLTMQYDAMKGMVEKVDCARLISTQNTPTHMY